MELTFTVVAAGRAAARLVVRTEPEATIAELARELSLHLEVPPAPDRDGPDLYLGETRLDPSSELSTVGLLHGSVLGLGAPVQPDTRFTGAFELAVGGGLAGGRAVAANAGDVVMIGRSASNSLPIDDPQASRRHAKVTLDHDGAILEDLGSTNGVDWAGHRLVGPQRLARGDVFRIGDTVVAVRDVEAAAPVLDLPAPNGTRRFNRPPRLPSPPVRAEIEGPVEPQEPSGRRFPLISLIAPLVIGVALAVLLQQVIFLAFVALSPVMMLANHVGDRRQGRQEYRDQRAAYDQALAEFDATLAAAVAADERLRRAGLPDPAAVHRIATAPTARLWERRSADDDFLRLRVGLAVLPSNVRLRGATAEIPPARLVPVAIDLPDAGVVGLAGPRPASLAWARALVSQAAVLHGPREVRIVVLTGQDAADDWSWTAWLPHLLPPDATWGCSRLVGAGRQQVEDRLAGLRRLIDDRLEMSRDQLRAGPPPGFRVLVVVDGARRLRTLDGVADVLRRGRDAGVVALCLDDDEHSLPEECGVTVVAADPAGTRVVVRRKGVASVDNVIVDGVSADVAERESRALAAVRDSGPGLVAEGGELPRAVRLLDLLGLDEPGEEDITRAWLASPAGRSTEAVIGVGGSGPFSVDLRRDGPHGLVAGTTGAGKSELLQTLVASLAVANRPDAMTFVLVDYKGGSAFKECRDLPHCVGMITDLDGHMAARALASLTAELKRRETLLAAVGARDIEDYWTMTAGRSAEPLARLAIVVDEFATLVDEVPEFVPGVVGIGMRGRSLGVHVILATQRPAGVVSAELRANVNLRLCLRVANPQESADVIDVPDAARIARDTPGRAYALTGYRDLTAFQTARVQVARGSGAMAAAHRTLTVEPLSLATLGARPGQEDAGDSDAAGPTDLSVLVAAVGAAARRQGIDRPPTPWCPPLAEVVSLEDLDRPASERTSVAGLSAVVGLLDRPEAQRQEPFVLDLDGCGSVLVIGAVRSGRSTALRTIAASLASAVGPSDLHLYAVDCGNGALESLAALPHCGAVVSGDDPDRVGRLLDLLAALVQARGRAGDAAGPAGAGGHEASPRVVVLLDRLEAFVARHAERDGGRLVDTLDRLLREGRAVGVTFVISGDRTAFSARLASAVESRLVLRQADRSDYGVLGVDVRQTPRHMPNGRAVWAQTGHEVQVAILGSDPAEVAQAAGVAQLAATAAATWPAPGPGRRPRRLDSLPARVTLLEATDRAVVAGAGREPEADGDAVATIGVGGDELVTVRVDLTDAGPGFVVAGPPRSGRSTALATMVHSLSGRGRKERAVVIITPRPSPLRALAELPGVVAVLSSGPELGAELEAAMRLEGPAALVVDDAELLGDGPVVRILESLVRTARDRELVVMAAATTDDLLLSRFRGWLADLRRSRSGLLLTPASAADGEVFDLRLPRSTSAGWPPGRALLVRRGQADTVQVAVAE